MNTQPPSGYVLLSADTSYEMEHRLIAAWRRMAPWEKIRRAGQLWETGRMLSAAGVRSRHPGASEDELRLRLSALILDRATMIRCFGWDPAEKGY